MMLTKKMVKTWNIPRIVITFEEYVNYDTDVTSEWFTTDGTKLNDYEIEYLSLNTNWTALKCFEVILFVKTLFRD